MQQIHTIMKSKANNFSTYLSSHKPILPHKSILSSSIPAFKIVSKVVLPKIVILNLRDDNEDIRYNLEYISSVYEDINISLINNDVAEMKVTEDSFHKQIKDNQNTFLDCLNYYFKYLEWIEKHYDHDNFRIYTSIEYFIRYITVNMNNLSSLSYDTVKRVFYYIAKYAGLSSDEDVLLEMFLKKSTIDEYFYIYETIALNYERKHDFIEANKYYTKAFNKNVIDKKVLNERYLGFEERMSKRLQRELTRIDKDNKTISLLNDYLNNKLKENNQSIVTRKFGSKSSFTSLSKSSYFESKIYDEQNDHSTQSSNKQEIDFFNSVKELNLNYLLISNIINAHNAIDSQIYIDNDYLEPQIKRISTLTIIYSWIKQYLLINDQLYQKDEAEYIKSIETKKKNKPFSYLSEQRIKIIFEKQEMNILKLTSHCNDKISRLSFTPRKSLKDNEDIHLSPINDKIKVNLLSSDNKENDKQSKSSEEEYILFGGEKYVKKKSKEEDKLQIKYLENNLNELEKFFSNDVIHDDKNILHKYLNEILSKNTTESISQQKDKSCIAIVNPKDNLLFKNIQPAFFENPEDNEIKYKCDLIKKFKPETAKDGRENKDETFISSHNASFEKLLEGIDNISPIKQKQSSNKKGQIENQKSINKPPLANPFIKKLDKTPLLENLFNSKKNQQEMNPFQKKSEYETKRLESSSLKLVNLFNK